MEQLKHLKEYKKTDTFNNDDLISIFDLKDSISSFLILYKNKLLELRTEQDFEKWLYEIGLFFRQLPLTKVYNSSSLGKIEEFNDLKLENQFLYLFKLRNTDKIETFGGNCYHFVIFLYNLISFLDVNNKLDKKIITFSPKYEHAIFVLGFENTYFVIDLFAKGLPFVQKIQNDTKIFISVKTNEKGETENILGEIENFDIFILKLNNGDKIYSNIFEGSKQFIDKLPITKYVIFNTKTNIQGTKLQLSMLYDEYDGMVFLFNYLDEQIFSFKLGTIDKIDLFHSKEQFKKYIFKFIGSNTKIDKLLDIIDIDFINKEIQRFKEQYERKNISFEEQFFPY